MTAARFSRQNAIDMLVPTVGARDALSMRPGSVYILTNKPNGILYVGVTSNLIQRIAQHRDGIVQGFTKRYGLKRLVYFEMYDDISTAIQREKNMKHWLRTWKVRLILATNPEWNDLFDSLL